MTARRTTDTGAAGFTLLEVLLALAIFGAAAGQLLQLVSQNLHALADAHHEAAVLERVEERMRSIADEARNGTVPPDGTTEGNFDPPHDHLRWELSVEPFTFPLPELSSAARSRARASSTLYAEPSVNSLALQPSVRLVVMRVLDEDGEEPFDPYTLFAVEPADVGPRVTQPTRNLGRGADGDGAGDGS